MITLPHYFLTFLLIRHGEWFCVSVPIWHDAKVVLKMMQTTYNERKDERVEAGLSFGGRATSQWDLSLRQNSPHSGRERDEIQSPERRQDYLD